QVTNVTSEPQTIWFVGNVTDPSRQRIIPGSNPPTIQETIQPNETVTIQVSAGYGITTLYHGMLNKFIEVCPTKKHYYIDQNAVTNVGPGVIPC
ncbi:MAG: hypothetical protein QW046_02925, partial [Candidatus Micrarchaeaceae archaeon]